MPKTRTTWHDRAPYPKDYIGEAIQRCIMEGLTDGVEDVDRSITGQFSTTREWIDTKSAQDWLNYLQTIPVECLGAELIE